MSFAAATQPPAWLHSSKCEGNAVSPAELVPRPSPSSPPAAKSPALDQTQQLHARFLRSQFRHHFLPHSSPSAHLNPLISSYTQNGRPLAAFNLYAHARKALPAALDSFTVPTVLKACALSGSLRCGAEVHGFAVKTGLGRNPFVQNSLIRMYSDCEDLPSAAKVFDEMPERDVVSWSTMIRSYGRSGLHHLSMGLMVGMLLAGVNPGETAMIIMINVLADAAAFEPGRQVHALMMKTGELGPPAINVFTALIDMYTKCGRVEMARQVFDRAEGRSTASWTAMIGGYARSGDFRVAGELFRKMAAGDAKPNEITILSLASSFGIFKEIWLGKWLHSYLLRHRLEKKVTLVTALLELYCKCGDFKSARALFSGMPEKGGRPWSVMISGYSQAGRFDDAFELFSRMEESGEEPDEIALVSLLGMCAVAGALDRGRRVHASVERQGARAGIVLATALVDMYAKCGEAEKAYAVFSGATGGRDICMWNAMLNGLAANGCGREAIGLFSRMEEAGIRPNGISFVGILKACSHAGLVSEGKQFFHRMVHEFGLAPSVEHYGCMVDLLGRAGFLDKAREMIKRMPVTPNAVVWGSLLAACKLHENLRLGELAAAEILKLDGRNVGCSILLSNIYAAQGRWSDVGTVRRAVKDRGLKKTPAESCIELNGAVHRFVSGDAAHPRSREIHEKVWEMGRELKRAGHVTNTSVVLLKMEGEEEKEAAVSFHSERLAIAFGLIGTAAGAPLRVVKNLRVCDDCHAATKLLSTIYGRVITVRDRNRYHHFAEGSCSCGDYW